MTSSTSPITIGGIISGLDTTSIITNVHTIDANLCHANYGVALGILSAGHGGDPGCNNNTIHPAA